MDEFKTIGTVVKRLRIEKELSQEQLAKLINTVRTVVSNIESGKRKPTEEQLISLSNKLEFDLVTFETKIKSYKSFEHYILAHKLIRLIDTNSNHAVGDISATIKQNYTLFQEFNYGDAEILRIYCETLILMYLEHNIEAAYDICMNFFNIQNFGIQNFQPKFNMPNQYYSMILNLGFCLYSKKDYHNFLTLYHKMLFFLENLYFNNSMPYITVPEFFKRIYITYLNNIADCYFVLNDYKNALHYCLLGIEQSTQLNIISAMYMLTELKFEILCKLNRLVEAKDAFFEFKYICQLTNHSDYFKTSSERLKLKYIELF